MAITAQIKLSKPHPRLEVLKQGHLNSVNFISINNANLFASYTYDLTVYVHLFHKITNSHFCEATIHSLAFILQ